MNDDVASALRQVAVRLGAAGVRFALGGSGLLWALGLDATVRDIDLQVDEGDEARLATAAGSWLVEISREGTELWASPWFARLSVGGVDVDAIGGMAFRHTGGVARLPLRASGHVELGIVRVPCADPALWWAVYRAYKPEKATLLEAVVDAAARRRVRDELGLPPDW